VRGHLLPGRPALDFSDYHRLTRSCAPLLALARRALGCAARRCEPPAQRVSPAQAPVWVHAGRLPQLRAAYALIDRLAGQGLPVLLTHDSPAGRRAAERRYAAQIAAGTLRQDWAPAAPLQAALAFLDSHQPRCGLLVERGAHPAMVRAAQACGVPLLLLDAALDEPGYWRAQVAGRVMRECYAGLAAVHAASPADARRLVRAGAGQVRVTGRLAEPDGRAVEQAMAAWAAASLAPREPQPEARAAQRAFGV